MIRVLENLIDGRDAKRLLGNQARIDQRDFNEQVIRKIIDQLPPEVRASGEAFFDFRTTPNGLPWHCDGQKLDGSENHMPWCKWTLSLALVDPSKYEGGDLVFRDGQRFRLPLGWAVLFSGDEAHSLRPFVGDTLRCQLIMHFEGNDDVAG